MKTCPVCRVAKPLDQFHRSRSTKDGRHSYCARCACERQNQSRTRNYSTDQKRRWQLKSRYGLSEGEFERMATAQDGRCRICETVPEQLHVDHCHNTGQVRGLLCRTCNVRLGGWDDLPWREKALCYLGIMRAAA